MDKSTWQMTKKVFSVVYYDGVCGLCNRTVRWLIRHDRKRILRYAPLQSELARELPPEQLAEVSKTLNYKAIQPADSPEHREPHLGAGPDRRKYQDPRYRGPERRKGGDRRQKARSA